MSVVYLNLVRQFPSMEILAGHIKRELERKLRKLGTARSTKELQRIWPQNEKHREKKIAQFARNYGFHLSFYSYGLCAIFKGTAEPSRVK
jgi:hypothetical protein